MLGVPCIFFFICFFLFLMFHFLNNQIPLEADISFTTLRTIRDWNALPDSLISSSEDVEDCVAKFPSLVRARD